MALNIGTLLAVLKLDSSGFSKGGNAAIDTARKLAAGMGGVAPAAARVASGLTQAANAARKAATEFGAATAASLAASRASIEKAGGDLGGAALGAGALTAGLAGVAGMAVKAASNFEETTNLVQTGFGSASVEVEAWAKTTAQAMGRSQQQMRDFAGGLQVMLAPMVGSQTQAAGMSKEFSKLAVDMGSFYNVLDKDALVALKSGLTGEVEPLKRFGIVMTEAQLNAFSLSKGVKKTVQQMSEAEKVQLRYNFVISRSSLVMGDAEKTSASFANQMKRMQSNAEDLAVTIGEPLRKALAAVLLHVNSLLAAFTQMDPWMAETIAKSLALAIAIGGIITATLTAAAAMAALSAALPMISAGFGLMMTAVLPIIVIIGSLVVIVGLLREVWIAVADDVKAAISSMATSAGGLLTQVVDAFAKASTFIIGIILKGGFFGVKALIKVADAMLGVVQGLLIKLKPLAEKLGLGEMLGSALAGLNGAKQYLAQQENEIDSFVGNVTQALDLREIIKNADFGAGSFFGTMVEMGKGAGESLSDGIKLGLSSSAKLLADVLGVDQSQVATALTAGKDTTFAATPGPADDAAVKAAKERQKELDRVNKLVQDDATAEDEYELADMAKKAKAEAERSADATAKFFAESVEAVVPAIASSLTEAITMATADRSAWQNLAADFVFSIADGLKGALKAIGVDSKGVEKGASGVVDFLASDAGVKTATLGAQMGDAALAGNLDVASAAGMIGNMIAPGIGGAIAQSIVSVVTMITDKIGELAQEIADGFIEMASIVSNIIVSNLGGKAQGAVEGAKQGVAFVSALVGTAVAAVSLAGVLAVVTAMWWPIVLALIGLSAVVLLVTTALFMLANYISGGLLIPLMALGGALVLAAGWFIALLQIGTMTKSFERFSLALEWGARQVITAVEPLFVALMPVAGVLLTVLEIFARLSSVFLAMLENIGFFDALFNAVRGLSIAFMQGALAILDSAEVMIKFAKRAAGWLGMDSTVERLQKIDDAIDEYQSGLTAGIAEVNALTLASAAAKAAEAAASEELAQAMDEATNGTLNLPEAFKVAAARNRAITPGAGDADGTGPADRRPIINIWLDGERMTDIKKYIDDENNYGAYLATRVPIALPRRRNNTQRPGN